jgi:cell division protein FtsB
MKKRQPWIRWVLLAMAMVILYQMVAGPSGLLKLVELRREQQTQRHRIDSLTMRKQELILEKKRLLTDSAYLEKLARKDLGMAKPGEKVYRFMAPAATPLGDSVAATHR